MTWITVRNALLLAGLLPLAGFLILALLGRRIGRGAGRGTGGMGGVVEAGGGLPGLLATGFAVCSFAAAVMALILWVAPDEFNRRAHYAEAFTFRWITMPAEAEGGRAGGAGVDAFSPARGNPAITVGMLADSLTVTFCVLWTFIALMVHLYATGWRTQAGAGGGGGGGAGDSPRLDGRLVESPRFYSLLQLVSVGMLGLFLSNSFFQMVICWQIIAIAAWLLMAMETTAQGEPSGSTLPMLFTQLLGTAAFIAGVAILATFTGTVSGLGFFDDQGNSILAVTLRNAMGVKAWEYLRYSGTEAGVHWLTWVGICFLIAALTRMAQFPFFHWMDRASRARTPAVALLGAAFLGSGVFLVARVFPLLTLDCRLILAMVGALTAVLAGSIALVQSDIRRILAWAAVAQGGMMVLFLGSGGYVAGVMHLFTQTFILTSLVLAAGVIGSGLGSWDLHAMGGLWKRFPMTAAASLVGALALAGAPLLSGTYSGRLGIACLYDYTTALRASTSGLAADMAGIMYWAGVITTYLLATAIGRWWWLIFAGVNRQPKLLEKAQESPLLTLPVFILAALSVGAWFEFSRLGVLISKSIAPVLTTASMTLEGSEVGYARAVRDMGWAFLGLGLAVAIYLPGFAFAERVRRLPFVSVLDYWVRQGFFAEEMVRGVGGVLVWIFPRLVLSVDRLVAVAAKVLELTVGGLVAGVGLAEQPKLVERKVEVAPPDGATPG